MKLLLDTHLLLWASGKQNSLPEAARTLILDRSNTLYFSAASLWEIAVKNGLQREDFEVDARLLRRGLVAAGYEELAITGEHAIAVQQLPALHRDPFDRLLVAQAVVEGFVLLTSDSMVAKYPGPVRRV